MSAIAFALGLRAASKAANAAPKSLCGAPAGACASSSSTCPRVGEAKREEHERRWARAQRRGAADQRLHVLEAAVHPLTEEGDDRVRRVAYEHRLAWGRATRGMRRARAELRSLPGQDSLSRAQGQVSSGTALRASAASCGGALVAPRLLGRRAGPKEATLPDGARRACATGRLAAHRPGLRAHGAQDAAVVGVQLARRGRGAAEQRERRGVVLLEKGLEPRRGSRG